MRTCTSSPFLSALLVVLVTCAGAVVSGCSPDSSSNNPVAGLLPANDTVSLSSIDDILQPSRPVMVDPDLLSDGQGSRFTLDARDGEAAEGLAGIGDVNGDGLSDYAFNTNQRTWIVPGSGRLAAELPLAELDASTAFQLDEGLRLTPVGDINGDGIGDLAWLIYDRTYGSSVSGVRLVFGRADGELATVLQGLPNGVDSLVVINEARRSDIRSIAPAGDLNADGYDDLLIGAYAFNSVDFDAPNAWVVYGRATGFPPLMDLSRLGARDGLTLKSGTTPEQQAAIDGSVSTGYNASVTGDFDFNGDGIDDIAIGASRYDWVEDVGASHTYVVFGSRSRSAGKLDLTALDAADGVDIAGPDLGYQPSPDGVAAVGDINADGISDLAVLDEAYTGGIARVLFGGMTGSGTRIDRTALPPASSIEFRGITSVRQNIRLVAAGDIDDDGIADLIAQTDSDAAIVYGRTGRFPKRIDLSSPTLGGVTLLTGEDAGLLVPLGDIDGDGIDDIGVGWSTREVSIGNFSLGDLNGDGVDDLSIGPYEAEYYQVLHVLYGFGSEGFSVVSQDETEPEPLTFIDPYFFNRLLAAADVAARSPLAYLNDQIAADTTLSGVAADCIAGGSGAVAPATDAPLTAFDCGDDALSFSFEWGNGKFGGTAGGGFTRAEFEDDVLQRLQYVSEPPPIDGPGSNPYQAHVTFDRDGDLVLGDYGYLDDPTVPRCTVEVFNGQTRDDPKTCALLFAETREVLMSIFGTRQGVTGFQYLD